MEVYRRHLVVILGRQPDRTRCNRHGKSPSEQILQKESPIPPELTVRFDRKLWIWDLLDGGFPTSLNTVDLKHFGEGVRAEKTITCFNSRSWLLSRHCLSHAI